MMHRVNLRSSICRVGQVANKRKELCRPLSSTTGTSNNGSNNVKNIRSTSFTSAAVSGNSPSWSDIPVGHSTFHRIRLNLKSSRFVGKSAYSNNAGNNFNANDDVPGEQEFRSVYVHPLSQIVLEYLQNSHHEWVVSKGLDRSLTLHRDGSFELKKVPLSLSSISTTGPLSPSPSVKKDQSKKNIDSNDNMRIWTSYDEKEKKHWLTARRGLFRQRFLLQDNLLTAWQANRGVSVAERLQVAVDEMVRAIDRLDRQEQQQATLGQQWQQKGQRRFRKR